MVANSSRARSGSPSAKILHSEFGEQLEGGIIQIRIDAGNIRCTDRRVEPVVRSSYSLLAGGNHAEAYISPKTATPATQSRVSRPYAHQSRSSHPKAPPSQGPQTTCATRRQALELRCRSGGGYNLSCVVASAVCVAQDCNHRTLCSALIDFEKTPHLSASAATVTNIGIVGSFCSLHLMTLVVRDLDLSSAGDVERQ